MVRTTFTVRSMAGGAALAVLVAACSASAAAPTANGPGATSATAASPDVAASQTARPAPTVRPSVGAAAQSPEPSAPTACDLITPAEVAKVMHLSAPVTSTLVEAYCGFDSGGSQVLYFSYRPDRPDIVESWQSNGLQPVPGIGDSALWNKADGTFIVIKNNAVVAITFDDSMTLADRFKFGKAVAAIMATRM
jgi:hypothetical protein